MSFKDIFKSNFIEQFVNNISLSSVITSLIIALIFSLLIYFVYLFTCDKTIYSKKFNVTMSLMSIVTASIVMAMQANVVISLGMVGALSIVRFRTAIKEPKDLLFLFWSISNGIIIGAGLYSVSCILMIVLTFGLLLFEVLPDIKKPLLLVINTNDVENLEEIEKVLEELNIRFNTKSKNMTNNKVDVIYEISVKNDEELVNKLNKNKKIHSFSLLRQD